MPDIIAEPSNQLAYPEVDIINKKISESATLHNKWHLRANHMLALVILRRIVRGYPSNTPFLVKCSLKLLRILMNHQTGRLMTAPDRCYYLNQAYLSMFIVGLKKKGGETNRPQTATDVVMVIK